MKAWLPSSVFLAAWGVCVFAQDKPVTAPTFKPSIAVNPLEALGVGVEESATLTDVLRNELIGTKKYQVMERDQMSSILKEQGFQQSGACTEEACLVEMGRVLGIEQLIAGSVGRVGKAYSINVRIVSVQTGQILHTVSHTYTGPIEDLLTNEIKVVAAKLAGGGVGLGGRTNKKSKGPLILVGAAAGVIAAGVVVGVLVANNIETQENTQAEATFQWAH